MLTGGLPHSDDEDDKDEEAAALVAELDETMSRAGSDWSHLAWWGDNSSEMDMGEYEIRKVGGFTIARPRRVRVLVERANSFSRVARAKAREKKQKAVNFVDRQKEKVGAAAGDLTERREHALAVIKRAAREKKQSMGSGAAAVREKAGAKVLGARDRAVSAKDKVAGLAVHIKRARRERREQQAAAAQAAPVTSPTASPTEPLPAIPRLRLDAAAVELVDASAGEADPAARDGANGREIDDDGANSEDSWQSASEDIDSYQSARSEIPSSGSGTGAGVGARGRPAPASVNVLPRSRWSEPSDVPNVRGPTYFDDGKKVEAPDGAGSLCSLFACQAVELSGEHLAGSSCRRARSSRRPPPSSSSPSTLCARAPRATTSSNSSWRTRAATSTRTTWRGARASCCASCGAATRRRPSRA